MSSLFSEIKTFLKAQSNVTDIVGAGDDARIYPRNLKAGIKDQALVITGFPASESESLNEGNEGEAKTRIQIDAYGNTEDEADKLIKQIDKVFRPIAGGMFRGYLVPGARYIHCIESEGSPREGSNPPIKGDTHLRYWSSRDYMFTHTEPQS